VFVGVFVDVGVCVLVGVGVIVFVGVFVGVSVEVRVLVGVFVGVAVFSMTVQVTESETRLPPLNVPVKLLVKAAPTATVVGTVTW